LCNPAAADFFRNFPCKPHQGGSSDGGQDSQAWQRISKQLRRKPGDQGNQRWLIHVAPIQMLGASQVIQLIPKDPVTIRGEEVKE
jgi:hypothetical protein